MPHLPLQKLELTSQQVEVTMAALCKYQAELHDKTLQSFISNSERDLYQANINVVNATLTKLNPKRFPHETGQTQAI